MELGLDVSLDRPDTLRAGLRPLAIWFGLASFLAGAVLLGDALAAHSGAGGAFVGPLLLVLGVSSVGGGFLLEPTDLFLDPEIAFSGREWYFLAAVSALFFLLAVLAALAVVV